jgi:protease I
MAEDGRSRLGRGLAALMGDVGEETKATAASARAVTRKTPIELRRNEKAQDFVRRFFAAHKPVAAICHAPWTLIDTGLAPGRRLTSYHSIRTDLENAGAEWVDKEVVVDDNLITSRNPDDIPAFNRAFIEKLSEEQPELVR